MCSVDFARCPCAWRIYCLAPEAHNDDVVAKGSSDAAADDFSQPSARAAERAAQQLRCAFENVGFYYLAGHGVPQALIDTAYAEAARFHALPLEKKLALKVD